MRDLPDFVGRFARLRKMCESEEWVDEVNAVPYKAQTGNAQALSLIG